jgi:hypothetical protein
MGVFNHELRQMAKPGKKEWRPLFGGRHFAMKAWLF